MAKRYHQSKKDRMHERVGEIRHDVQSEYRINGGAEHYAGMEPRRRQEMRDAGMIHEDPRAIANMPQDVKYHSYPRVSGYLPEVLDDTLRGVDHQMDVDNRGRMSHFFPKKV